MTSKILGISSLFGLVLTLISCNESHLASGPDLRSYQLVFEDDFNGGLLDSSKWKTKSDSPAPYDRIPPRASCNYDNAEIFLDENVRVIDGTLRLVCKTAPYSYKGLTPRPCGMNHMCDINGCDSFEVNVAYQSGAVFARKGYNHGYFECRAKIPSTLGVYPVFWLWHHDEIVVFEFFGDPRNHFISIHNKDQYATQQFSIVDDYSNDYHNYAVEWTPTKATWYFDNHLIREEYRYYNTDDSTGLESPSDIRGPDQYFTNPAFPDSTDRWLRPNISLRTFEWSAAREDHLLPDELIIDYIRVYQKVSR